MVSRRSVYGDGLLKQKPGSRWQLDSTLTRGFRQAIEWTGPQGALRRAPAPPRGRYARPVRRPIPGQRVRVVCLALLQAALDLAHRLLSAHGLPPSGYPGAAAAPVRSDLGHAEPHQRPGPAQAPGLTIPTRSSIRQRRMRPPVSGRAGPPSPCSPAAPPPPGATCGSACCSGRSPPPRSTSPHSTPGPRGATPTSTDSTASSTTTRSPRTRARHRPRRPRRSA